MEIVVLGIVQVIMAVLLIKLYKYNRSLNKDVATLRVENKNLAESKDWLIQEYNGLQVKYTEEQQRNKKIISQKKSSETRLGSTLENIVTLIDGLHYNGKNMHHLGQPLDYVYFDYDNAEIVFVEVKTGQSRESKRQQLLKNIIKQGKVYYERLSINDKGVKVKREANDA